MSLHTGPGSGALSWSRSDVTPIEVALRYGNPALSAPGSEGIRLKEAAKAMGRSGDQRVCDPRNWYAGTYHGAVAGANSKTAAWIPAAGGIHAEMNRAPQRGSALRWERGLDGRDHAEEALADGLVDSWEIAEHFGVPDELVQLRAPSISANTAAPRPAARSGRLGPGDA